MPVRDWMALQGRFRHLLKPEYADVVDAFQKEVDHNWHWIIKQEELSEVLAGHVNDFDGEVLMRCI